jgi:hypothetical protein
MVLPVREGGAFAILTLQHGGNMGREKISLLMPLA